MAKFTISLDKIIDEFKLETIYTPKNASEIEIDEADGKLTSVSGSMNWCEW